jgi:hypothetical protein
MKLSSGKAPDKFDWNCGREAPAAATPADLARRIRERAWPG